MSAVERSISRFSIEKLKGPENYMLWKFYVKKLLVHNDLWCSIVGYPEDDKSSPNLKKAKDERALARIRHLVDDPCVSLIINAKTSKDAWLSLKNAYDKDKEISSKIKLLRNLCSIKLEDFGGNIKRYVYECLSLSQQLAAVNKPIDDEFLAAIILQGLPPKFDPIIMALESSTRDLTSDIVIAKLLEDTKGFESKGRNRLIAEKSDKSDTRQEIENPMCSNSGKTSHVNNECTDKRAEMIATQDMADTWFVDSGASTHMTGRRDWMYAFSAFTVEVNVASGQILQCLGVGSVCLNFKECDLILRDVMYVPGLEGNLLSVNSLAVEGLRVEFNGSTCKIFRKTFLMASIRSTDGVYKIRNNAKILSKNNKKVSKETSNYMLGYDSLNSQSYEIDFQDTEVTDNCNICIFGDQIRFPFKKLTRNVATKRLDLVHTALCYIRVASYSDKRYILTFVDDHSEKLFAYFLNNKSEVASAIKRFVRFVENQCEEKLKAICTDNGIEYVNTELNTFFKEKGIVHQVILPHGPQLSGPAERLNTTLVECIRCMLYNAGLDPRLWPEAANTAGYLINRFSSGRIDGKTPEEIWSGNKVTYDHLKMFGCEAYVNLNDDNQNTLQPTTKRYIFVGYEDNGTLYRLYDSETHTIIRSRDVIFNEFVFPCKMLVKNKLIKNQPL